MQEKAHFWLIDFFVCYRPLYKICNTLSTYFSFWFHPFFSFFISTISFYFVFPRVECHSRNAAFSMCFTFPGKCGDLLNVCTKGNITNSGEFYKVCPQSSQLFQLFIATGEIIRLTRGCYSFESMFTKE